MSKRLAPSENICGFLIISCKHSFRYIKADYYKFIFTLGLFHTKLAEGLRVLKQESMFAGKSGSSYSVPEARHSFFWASHFPFPFGCSFLVTPISHAWDADTTIQNSSTFWLLNTFLNMMYSIEAHHSECRTRILNVFYLSKLKTICWISWQTEI